MKIIIENFSFMVSHIATPLINKKVYGKRIK